MAFPKSGKLASSPTNYGTISSLSIFSKIFEKVVHAQTCLHLTFENIIINEQFGF